MLGLDRDSALRAQSLVAFAAVAISIGLCFSNGHLDPASLLAMTSAAAAALLAAIVARHGSAAVPRTRVETWLARSPRTLLGFGIAASLGLDALLPPGYYADPRRLGLFRPLVAACALLAWSYRWPRSPRVLARARFPLLLVLAAAMAALVIRASPQPAIDVFSFHQLGPLALWRGRNPYALEYPNVYGPGTWLYSKEVLTGDGMRVISFPYLPLTLLLGLPAVLLAHDFRWLLLACVLFTAWCIRRLGRGALEGELAAVLFLLQPRAWFVLEQSWDEPQLLAAMALTLLAVERWRAMEPQAFDGGPPRRLSAWLGTGVAGGLLAAGKQYSPLLFVPLYFCLPERGRSKAAAFAAAIAAAVTLPFVLWDPRAFATGTLLHHLRQRPFREDSLSWPAAIGWMGGLWLPAWPAFLLAAAALAATLARRVTSAQAVTAAAAGLMVWLLFNRQAFANNYWLAAGLFLLATALGAAPAPHSGDSSTSRIPSTSDSPAPEATPRYT